MSKQQLLEKYNIFPISYKKLKNVDILTTNKQKLVLKKGSNYNIYEYLRLKKFNNFPSYLTNNDDEFELTEYLNNSNVPDEQRIEDLIYLVSILHTKTTFYKNVDEDKIKKIYEDLRKKQDYLYNFYLTMQDSIELEVYMSPSHYLLIRNISNFYKCIIKSKEYIEKWYQQIKDSKKMRYCMIHGNLDKSHLIENDSIYLISWNKAKIGIPVYDLESIYRLNQENIDLIDLLDVYQTKYELKDIEKYLLFSLVALPDKIEAKDNEYDNVREVLRVVEYVNKVKNVLWKD